MPKSIPFLNFSMQDRLKIEYRKKSLKPEIYQKKVLNLSKIYTYHLSDLELNLYYQNLEMLSNIFLHASLRKSNEIRGNMNGILIWICVGEDALRTCCSLICQNKIHRDCKLRMCVSVFVCQFICVHVAAYCECF